MVQVDLSCRKCKKTTPHDVTCNGGTRLKPYITQYDGRDWSGDIEHLGVVATDEDGTPVREHGGRGERSDKRYTDNQADRIGAKRDRKRSDLRRARGSQKLHFS